jgi:hypothetical protein
MRKQLIAAGTAIALGIATTMTGTIAFARGGGGGGGFGGGGHVGGFGGGGRVAGLAAEVTALAPVSEASVSRQATAVSEASGSRWITPDSEAMGSRRTATGSRWTIPASKATGSPGATLVSATVVSDTVALLRAFTLTVPTVAWVRTGPIPGIAIRTATRMAATGIS